jgi:hypothetical protein
MAPSKNINAPIISLSAFLDRVDSLRSKKRTLFRGQPEDCTLLPRIARDLPPRRVERIEHQMLQDFLARSIPYLNLPPKEDELWDWLAIAQHYGMATRLLDWTENPLAALWFAVRTPTEGKSSGVVWVFRAPEEEIATREASPSPFELERTVVFRPKHLTKTIIAQGGWFTAHKMVGHEKGFIPFERITRLKDHRSKISISHEAFADLRLELDLCGINQASMFPGPENLCAHLNQQFGVLPHRPCRPSEEAKK